jgi:catechol 2,3-dioxygenase-like lactoylglutathione lyase family enzyme
MITGVNHITLSVRDLEESINFYSNILNFKLLAKWPNGAYLSAGDIWLALILDPKLRVSPLPEYTHIGLTVSIENFPILSQRIQQSGAKIWQENKSEGASLYFLDPNNHKLEIHASGLETRIKTAKESPWQGLEFFV